MNTYDSIPMIILYVVGGSRKEAHEALGIGFSRQMVYGVFIGRHSSHRVQSAIANLLKVPIGYLFPDTYELDGTRLASRQRWLLSQRDERTKDLDHQKHLKRIKIRFLESYRARLEPEFFYAQKRLNARQAQAQVAA